MALMQTNHIPGTIPIDDVAPSPSAPARGRLRFSVKTLLVAITVSAVPLFWLGNHYRSLQRTAREQAIVSEWRSIGDVRSRGFRHEPRTELTTISILPRKTSLTPDEQRLLEPLVRLTLVESPRTDVFLANLKHAKQLRFLELDHSGVTDYGLQHLAHVPALLSLSLSETNVTDQGLRHLAHLSQLTTLQLHNTQITDEALDLLAQLPRLGALGLTNTLVTKQGVERFGAQRVSQDNGAVEFGPYPGSQRMEFRPARIAY
jgi:hypothetical protein